MVGGESVSRDEVLRALIVRHPLQPFSAEYFNAPHPRLFSYAAEYVPASGLHPEVQPVAEVRKADIQEEASDDEDVAEPGMPFSMRPLDWPSEQPRSVTLDDLKRFLRNPCRYWLERRLELSLLDAEEQLADDEPFLPDYQRRCTLAERLLPFIRHRASASELLNQAQSGTEYPTGVFGGVLLQQEIGLLTTFGQRVAALTAEPPLPPVAGDLTFTLDSETWHLTGALTDLRAEGLIRWRYDDTRPTDYLTGWIDHLWLNALSPPEVTLQTTWVSRDGSYRLKPCPEARSHLETLIECYARGFAAPLHFFPKSAWAYAKATHTGTGDPLVEARKIWEENYNGYGESTAPTYRLALRGVSDPLDESFEHLADASFGPLLKSLEDPRLS